MDTDFTIENFNGISPVRKTPASAFLRRRLAAYLVDVIPIVFVTATVFYFFFGFDENIAHYSARRSDDIESRISFLRQRNQIRDLSFVFYIFYCVILESTPMRGTIGKWLLGIQVLDDRQHGLSVGRSAARNFAKTISYLPLSLGFLWAIWAKDKRTWHDKIAKTHFTKR